MKATIFMTTYNKNDLLPNTLFSIARQKTSFPYEVCIVDDHSDVDPEPIIRKFIPNAKYKRLDKRYSFDVVSSYALDLASDDSDILILQSADVIHGRTDTIERLCMGVGEKKICMAAVSNTYPPHNAYKNFKKFLPKLLKQSKGGKKRSKPGKDQASYYFFLGAIRRMDYESLKCSKEPYCDIMLAKELIESKFIANYHKKLIGFHQDHPKTSVPCSRINTCTVFCCSRDRCLDLGLYNLDKKEK